MHSRFDAFREQALGRQLEALIDTPQRYVEYAALSRAEVPAVAAIVHDVRQLFPEVEADASARQFCGAMVAEVMRRHHHEVLRPRGRVPGGYFTYGVVWTPTPQQLDWVQRLEALRGMPAQLVAALRAIPAVDWRRRPDGIDFAAVEHACHLRDLDRIYCQRVARVLAEEMPEIASVDGNEMSLELAYLEQDGSAALDDFVAGRRHLLAALAGAEPAQRGRLCLFGGERRMSLEDLVEDMLQHDRAHLLEVEELTAELRALSV